MSLALDDAGLSPRDIGHINAHGTSTPLNDATESEAILKVFGEDAPPVTSTKGVTGHLVGAAGAAEAVATLLAGRDGLVPPVANYETPDPDIKADVVHGEPRSISSVIGLSNSFGFGGHNATLIVAAS
jgi:3-oxoacyl-[acyl-carrier-protein] synthase II